MDFKYDDYQDDPPKNGDIELDEDEIEHRKVMEKQKQFQENYKALMQEEDDKNIKKKEAKKQSKKEPQPAPVPKKPPVAPPAPENNSKAKLIEQHIKLKSQLKQLAVKMDQILVKEKQRRKKKMAQNAGEEDERIKELRSELKSQELQIQKNKGLIQQLRKNLDNKYDINKIVQKEDELKLLKKQLDDLEKEKASLEKIRNMQDKAMQNSEDEETKRKYERMKSDLAELTQKNRKYQESINEKEKQLRKLHENYIVKEQKIKQIENKLKDKKSNSNSEDINEYTISQLEESIKELERERMQVEKQGHEKLKQLEREKKDLKTEVEKKKLIIEEKEKDLRLNQIKYKDIVRLINSCNQEAKKQKQNKDEVESKTSGKRLVDKKGRQAPKIDPVPTKEEHKDEHLVDKIDYKEKHEVGVGDNLDDYDEYAQEFCADDDIVSAEKKEEQKEQTKKAANKEDNSKPSGFSKPNLTKKQ